jgi:hypothetical protein
MRDYAAGDRLRRWARAGACALLTFAVLAGTAAAQTGNNNNNGTSSSNNNGNSGVRIKAPEINPGATLGAITLLVGGVLILTDRVRKAGSAEQP